MLQLLKLSFTRILRYKLLLNIKYYSLKVTVLLYFIETLDVLFFAR